MAFHPHLGSAASLSAPSTPTIALVTTFTQGALIRITPADGRASLFEEMIDGVASGRTVAASGASPVDYTIIAADMGVSVTFVATNAVGTSAASNVLAYSPTQFSGLLYLIDNSTGQDGAYASIVDRSPGARTLTVSVNAPIGFPRNWEEGGRAVIGFNSGLTQTAKDLGASAATYAGAMHLAGTGFVFRGSLLDTNANGQVFGTHTGSSNGNSFAMFWDGITIHVYVTSTTGGGTVHIDASTAAIRPGDVFTCTFLHQTDKTWTCKFVREARAPGDSQTITNLNGNYGSTIAAGDAPAGLTVGNLTGLAGNPKGLRLHTLAAHRTLVPERPVRPSRGTSLPIGSDEGARCERDASVGRRRVEGPAGLAPSATSGTLRTSPLAAGLDKSRN